MQKLLVLVGPTASGKTDLSIRVAQTLHAEIISGDSMQIYRGMAISTAQPSIEEMCGIPHYGIAEREPTQAYSAAQFQKAARQHIREIAERHKVPFVVGGTGLYVNGLIYDFQFADTDAHYRGEAENYIKCYGLQAAVDLLQDRASELMSGVEPTDERRVIRALELLYLRQVDTAQHRMTDRYAYSPYDLHFFCLTMDRARLYERINARVDQMMAQGLLAEVKAIWALGLPSDTPAMRAIGVKEFIPYFNGDIGLEEAVRTVKKNTRRFAKRQLTWFRRDPNLQWIDLDQVSREEAVQLIVEAYQAE